MNSTMMNENVTAIASSRNIFASYDASKIENVLNSVTNTERKSYYEDMGITLENVHSLDTALKVSGLGFEVKKLPIFHQGLRGEYDFHQCKDLFATVRDDNGETLGVVGKDYQVLQNKEAFAFLDTMVLEGAKFVSAGNFKKNGGASYIQMSTEPLKILDDDFDNFILLANGHDGSSAIRVVITPVRAWCKNTATLALRKATFSVSVRHTINMNDNLERAREVLLANTHYLEALKEEAERLAVKPFSEEAFKALVNKLFPKKEEASDTVQIRNLVNVEALLTAYKQDDLANFKGTAWGAIQAFADFESHKPVFAKRKEMANNGTANFQNVIIYGMPLLNKAYQAIQEAV